MIEKEQWPPNNSPNLNATEISSLGSDARSYFENFIRSQNSFRSKSRTGEDTLQFSLGQINKAVSSSRNSLTEYVEDGGRHSEHFPYPKSVHT